MPDPQPARRPGRLAGLDTVRAATTLLVVFHHAALTYGGTGGWYYREVPISSAASSVTLTILCALDQSWFMGLFFLLAGYFTPGALQRKGSVRFIADRVLRLGLPILVFGLVLSPITVALADRRPLGGVVLWMIRHAWFGIGPLWFCGALLLFSLAALVWYRLGAWAPARFPSNRVLAIGALLTGAAAFALRLHWPVGDSVHGMQLGYFASYVALFGFGCVAGRRRWFASLPAGTVRLWARVAVTTAPILPIAIVIAQVRPDLFGPFIGGWSAGALLYAFWEPFVALGACLGLVALGLAAGGNPSPFLRHLGRRAYTIYVIHPPILVGVAVVWQTAIAPPLVKWLITGSVASGLCYLMAGLLLRMPGVRRVL